MLSWNMNTCVFFSHSFSLSPNSRFVFVSLGAINSYEIQCLMFHLFIFPILSIYFFAIYYHLYFSFCNTVWKKNNIFMIYSSINCMFIACRKLSKYYKTRIELKLLGTSSTQLIGLVLNDSTNWDELMLQIEDELVQIQVKITLVYNFNGEH